MRKTIPILILLLVSAGLWAALQEAEKNISSFTLSNGLKVIVYENHMAPVFSAVTYANEADMLNVALFGQTAKQWRDANTKLEGNMRDHATIEQLLVLANLEGMNAEFIHMALPQSERLKRLNAIAIRQMQTLTAPDSRALSEIKGENRK